MKKTTTRKNPITGADRRNAEYPSRKYNHLKSTDVRRYITKELHPVSAPEPEPTVDDDEFMKQLAQMDVEQEAVVSNSGALGGFGIDAAETSDPGDPAQQWKIPPMEEDPLASTGVGVPNPSLTSFGQKQPKRRATSRKAKWDIPVDRTYIPDPCPFEPYEEVTGAMTPSDSEDFDNVREAIKVLKSAERTIVFAIIVDAEDEERNMVSAIRCAGGTSFGGYAHDVSRDAYLVQCIEFHQLGAVPFSLVLTMANIGTWQVKVPIPESVLEKHFAPSQKKALDVLRERYPTPRYEIHFMQMLGCH